MPTPKTTNTAGVCQRYVEHPLDNTPPTPKENEVEYAEKEHMTSPAWRYSQVMQMIEKQKAGDNFVFSRLSDDPLVTKHLLEFYKVYSSKKSTPQDLKKLRNKHPDMYMSQQLWESRLVLRQERALAIEAFICGDFYYADIAKELRLKPGTVWWYEKTFFDVRDILDSLPLMLIHVFNPDKAEAPNHKDIVWKAITWDKGVGFEGLVNLYLRGAAQAPEAARVYNSIIEYNVAAKTVEGTAGMEINNYNTMEILESYQKIVENAIEKAGDTATEADNKGLMEFLGHYANFIGVAKYQTEFTGVEGELASPPPENMFKQRRLEIDMEAEKNKTDNGGTE